MIVGLAGVYMKRFGWPRPALLIGYVLSNQVEKSIYHVTATVDWKLFTHPIVIVLVGLVLFSIYAAVRFRPAPSQFADDGPHAAQGLNPQTLFTLVVGGSHCSSSGTERNGIA